MKADIILLLSSIVRNFAQKYINCAKFTGL
jgi:hypothetical protein